MLLRNWKQFNMDFYGVIGGEKEISFGGVEGG